MPVAIPLCVTAKMSEQANGKSIAANTMVQPSTVSTPYTYPISQTLYHQNFHIWNRPSHDQHADRGYSRKRFVAITYLV